MGKRKRSRSCDNRKLLKKIKKLEKKILEREEESSNDEGPGTPPLPVTKDNENVAEEIENLTGDISDELLQALGKEGEETVVLGEEIQQQLAERWSNISQKGLGKEARELLMQKYKTPNNFLVAVPPKMNDEIMATMSDTSNKRDKRIIFRQSVLGKIMTSLGRALTNVMKGNLNTKLLVEQINDSAKLTAEIYYQDSSSRRFFALAGTTPTIKEAIKNTKSDEFLFGKDCGEKIKAAQTIQKNSNQIKKKQPVAVRQENWRGPLQPQHQYRSGQPYRPPARGRTTHPAPRTQPAQKKPPPQPQKQHQQRYRRY